MGKEVLRSFVSRVDGVLGRLPEELLAPTVVIAVGLAFRLAGPSEIESATNAREYLGTVLPAIGVLGYVNALRRLHRPI